MDRKSISKSIGTYLLGGTLALGAGYTEANAQNRLGDYVAEKVGSMFYSSQKTQSKKITSSKKPKVKKKSTKSSETRTQIKSIAKADNVVMKKSQYESLSAQEKSRWVPLYYVTKDSTKGSVPMYSLPGVYDGELLYVRRVSSSSSASKTKSPTYLPQSKKPAKKTTSQRQRQKPSNLEKEADRFFDILIKGYKAKSDSLAAYDARIKAEESKADSGKTDTQYAQPLDMHLNADSSDLAHGYKDPDTTAILPAESKPFMVANNDSLYLLGAYGELTKEQKIGWNKKVIEYTERGFRRTAPGMLVRASMIRTPEKASETRGGLEVALGKNHEGIVGTFIDIPLTSWLSTEGFMDWYIARGNPIFAGTQREVTLRDRQLIGNGIAGPMYKFRRDGITTTTEERAIADIGAGLTFKLTDYFELPLRVGLNVANQQKTTEGMSTIWHERNNLPIGQPETITNSKDDSKGIKTNLALSAGARFNLTKNLSLGASYNRIGKNNSARVNMGVKF